MKVTRAHGEPLQPGWLLIEDEIGDEWTIEINPWSDTDPSLTADRLSIRSRARDDTGNNRDLLELTRTAVTAAQLRRGRRSFILWNNT